VATKESHVTVMLSAAKHLAFSVAYEDEILRLSPQDDIATQSRRGGEGKNIRNPLDCSGRNQRLAVVCGIAELG
jgi:hypothetical protein